MDALFRATCVSAGGPLASHWAAWPTDMYRSQELRDRKRLRKALADDRRRWGQRLHAYLMHEGWPCLRSNFAQAAGAALASALRLPAHARLQVDSLVAVTAALEAQLQTVDAELRRFDRADERCQA